MSCYLECVEGGSSKFWKCTVNGSSTVVQYGKIGTPGTSQKKDHGSPESARKFFDKLKAQKQGKGYVPKGRTAVIKTVLKKPSIVVAKTATSAKARIAFAEGEKAKGKQSELENTRNSELKAWLHNQRFKGDCCILNPGPGAGAGCRKYLTKGHPNPFHYWYCCRCGYAQTGGACVNKCDWGRFGWTCIFQTCRKGCPCQEGPKNVVE